MHLSGPRELQVGSIDHLSERCRSISQGALTKKDDLASVARKLPTPEPGQELWWTVVSGNHELDRGRRRFYLCNPFEKSLIVASAFGKLRPSRKPGDDHQEWLGKTLIQFLSVSKKFVDGAAALRDVSFKLEKGDFTFLRGASGAGKSTLLKLIYREFEPTSGQILVNGRNVSSIPRKKVPFLRRTIGVVFQDFRLIPRRTIFENISYLPQILGMGQQERKRLAYQTLRRVGLAQRMNSFPMQLSGGEQQRVAIARALINQPEILIADEPTGNLDPDLSWEIMRLFVEINGKGTTVLLATHEPSYVRAIGGRILSLDRGRLVGDRIVERQSRLLTDGSVDDELSDPEGEAGESES